MKAHAVLNLAKQLISCRSITPDDADCQKLLSLRLKKIGFRCEDMSYSGVTNLWARRGDIGPLIVFAGHTDVVPAGPSQHWLYDPFSPTEHEGYLYGRGAADMKSSLAAFTVAVEEFVSRYPKHPGSIALLITSDEEGIAEHGTAFVCNELEKRSVTFDYCIVGEPTSSQALGDICKNGRRGSLSGKITIQGTQGHIAYPHLSTNPIHQIIPALTELLSIKWDQGDFNFSPTAFQISHLNSGNGVSNVTPDRASVEFNLRFSTSTPVEILKSRVHSVLDQNGMNYKLVWKLSGEPFFTHPGTLSQVLSEAIQKEVGVNTNLSTGGGTSDGRFIAKICPQVIEFGPCNKTIHQTNERIEIATLEPLKNIYGRVLKSLLLPNKPNHV